MFGWAKDLMAGFLYYLVPSLFKKSATLIFIGLDEAGKTTLMYRLKENKMIQPTPTQFPTKETLQIGNINFTAFDIGGHKQVRRIWKDYLVPADGIVFIVDGCKESRFEEAKKEIHELLFDENSADIPVAILINKIDSPGCIGEANFIYRFDLFHHRTGKNGEKPVGSEDKRPLEIFPVSVLQCQGYGQAFKWLSEHIQ